jgi:hypothetical protein
VVKRAVLVLALVAATAHTVRADEDPLLLQAQELEHSGKTLRLVGILTVAAGVGMLTVSAILNFHYQCDFIDCDGTKWLLLSLGVPTLGFGITTWWMGQDEINHAHKLRAMVVPTRSGAMAGFGLAF